MVEEGRGCERLPDLGAPCLHGPRASGCYSSRSHPTYPSQDQRWLESRTTRVDGSGSLNLVQNNTFAYSIRFLRTDFIRLPRCVVLSYIHGIKAE